MQHALQQEKAVTMMDHTFPSWHKVLAVDAALGRPHLPSFSCMNIGRCVLSSNARGRINVGSRVLLHGNAELQVHYSFNWEVLELKQHGVLPEEGTMTYLAFQNPALYLR